MSLACLTNDQRTQLADRLASARGNAFALAYACGNASDAIRLGSERDEEALVELFRIARDLNDLDSLEVEFDLSELLNGKKSAF